MLTKIAGSKQLNWVKGIGGFLLAIGLIAIILGFMFSATPEIVEKTVTLPHSKVIIDSRFTVAPLHYKYTDFYVPSEARTAYLEVIIKVYSGNDINFEIYHGSSKIFGVRVNGGYSNTINLPGPGSYELRFDNSYSILTSKDVRARVILHWSELNVQKQELSHRGSSLMAGGLFLIVAGAVVYAIGSRVSPRIESVDSVLLDLATRKPLETRGVETSVLLKLESKGLSSRDVSKLIDVVSKARQVKIEANKPRFSNTYYIRIRGPKESTTMAAKDMLEFCRRTRKCKASFEHM